MGRKCQPFNFFLVVGGGGGGELGGVCLVMVRLTADELDICGCVF